MYMLGSGKGWGGALIKSPRRVAVYQVASVVQQRPHEKSPVRCVTREADKSQELSVHVISDFVTRFMRGAGL